MYLFEDFPIRLHFIFFRNDDSCSEGRFVLVLADSRAKYFLHGIKFVLDELGMDITNFSDTSVHNEIIFSMVQWSSL